MNSFSKLCWILAGFHIVLVIFAVCLGRNPDHASTMMVLWMIAAKVFDE